MEHFTKIPNKKRQARNTSGPDVHKRVQTQNRFATLQEAQSLKNKAKAQAVDPQDKNPSNQQGEEDNEILGEAKNQDHLVSPCVISAPLEGCSSSRPEEPQADPGSEDGTSGDMEVGDLDLDRMEAACSDKEPAKIPPQQVSLLEKVIIQAKNANTLGVVTESLKVTDGKGKHSKKEKEEDQVISRESKLQENKWWLQGSIQPQMQPFPPPFNPY